MKNDNKSFFAYVSSKERNKVKVGPLKDSTGNIITDNKITADIFNDYFASVFTTEDTNNIPIPDQIFTGHELDSLSKICLYESIVYKKLNEININKSPCSDDLHPKMLFELKDLLVKPLLKIFERSLETGIVPQDWREARASPLFKKVNVIDLKITDQ